jgi:ABC-type glycerol-3-phosphate transport system permease component
MNRRSLRKGIKRLPTHIFLVILSFLLIFPVLWAFSTSLKPEHEVLKYPPSLIPDNPVFDGYQQVLLSGTMPRYMLNSLIVAGITTLVTITVASLAGYAFSRYSFRGRGVLQVLILATIMMPGLTNLIPQYRMFTQLHLLNTRASLILIYAAWLVPLSTWTIRSFFDSVSPSLDEAALLDGCTRVQVLFKILFPIAIPGIIAAAIMNFVLSWNEFIVALIFITPERLRTATVGLYNYMNFYSQRYHILASAAIVMTVPIIVLFLFVRQRFMRGMIEGAVKG